MTAAGMTLVAITDHDTLAGAVEAACHAGPSGAPHLITGIEINTVGDDVLGRYGLGRDGEELHILGYGMDPADATFAAALERQRQGRRDRIALTLERVRALGMTVDLDLDARDAVDRRGRGAAARGAGARPGGLRDGTSTTPSTASWTHGAAVLRATPGPGPARGDRGHHRGGRHRGRSPTRPDAPDRAPVIAELMGWGLRGLECYYPRYDAVTTAADGGVRRRPPGCSPPVAATTMATSWTTPTAQEALLVPDAVADRLLEALAAMTSRDPARAGHRRARVRRRPRAPHRGCHRRRRRRVRHRRPGAAALPRLDAGLPDEPLRLRGDGGRAAGRRLLGGAGARDRPTSS